MVTQVRETAAAQKISAYVVLTKGGKEVATVHAHFAGTVRVDVWTSGDRALKRNAKARGLADMMDAMQQSGSAGGSGYNKFTAALAGLYIDGHCMFDHCGKDKRSERLMKQYLDAMSTARGPSISKVQEHYDAKAAKLGASFANIRVESENTGEKLVRVNFRAKAGGVSDFGHVTESDYDAARQAPDYHGYLAAHRYEGHPRRRYDSLFMRSGLDRLQALGYRVIQVI